MSVEIKIKKILVDVINELEEKRMLRYEWFMRKLNVSPATAWRYAKQIAEMFPNNIEYNRGILFLVKPFSEEADLPIELKYEAQKKTIESLQKNINEKERILKKLKNNHLTHMERALLEKDLDKLQRIIDSIKEELDKQLR